MLDLLDDILERLQFASNMVPAEVQATVPLFDVPFMTILEPAESQVEAIRRRKALDLLDG